MNLKESIQLVELSDEFCLKKEEREISFKREYKDLLLEFLKNIKDSENRSVIRAKSAQEVQQEHCKGKTIMEMSNGK